MSRNTITREIHKELNKLNDRIDRKILKGQRFDSEARRHRELLATLNRAELDSQDSSNNYRKPLRYRRSPVRRSLRGGVIARLFTLHTA